MNDLSKRISELRDYTGQKLTQFLNNGESLPDDVAYQIAIDFADSIPYGTLTGDDDTLDNWIFDNLEMITYFYGINLEK